MKCPKCRREIAYSAMSCRCGWKATVSAHTTAAPKPLKQHFVSANPQIREKLHALATEMRAKAGKKLETQRAGSEEVTKGHGSHCFCELCFPKRMKSIRGNQDATRMGDEADRQRKEKGDEK